MIIKLNTEDVGIIALMDVLASMTHNADSFENREASWNTMALIFHDLCMRLTPRVAWQRLENETSAYMHIIYDVSMIDASQLPEYQEGV